MKKITNSNNLQTADVPNPEIQTAEIPNPEIQTADVPNPEIQTAYVPNPEIQTAYVPNPEIQTAYVPNPEIQTADVPNPEIQTADVPNPEKQTMDVPNPEIRKLRKYKILKYKLMNSEKVCFPQSSAPGPWIHPLHSAVCSSHSSGPLNVPWRHREGLTKHRIKEKCKY